MFSVCVNSKNLSSKFLIFRSISSYFSSSKKLFETQESYVTFNNYASIPVNLCHTYNSQYLCRKANLYSHIENKRYYSKKKGSKQRMEEEDSDEDEDEEGDYDTVLDENEIGTNLITKKLPSLRIDTVLKAGLGTTKKKIEQDFYALKLRQNGIKVVKKSLNVHAGDELDCIKGFSPDTSRLLIVDRVVIKGVDKLTGAGMFPVKMEVFKSLVIENYEDPWRPDSLGVEGK